MTAHVVSVVAALLDGYGFLVVVLFAAAMVRGWIWSRRATAAETLKPALLEEFAEHMAGADQVPRLREAAGKNRRVYVEALMEFEGKVSGSSLDRLGKLTMELGVVEAWVRATRSRLMVERRNAFSGLAFVSAYEPCHRATGNIFQNAMKDADGAVRLAAARGASHTVDPYDIKRVCEFAITGSLLFRILLSYALRPHAGALMPMIREALQSDDAAATLGALEILIAWDVGIPLEDTSNLLQHAERQIRIAALRLAPLSPPSAESQAVIIGMLADADTEVRTAAALSAGRMRIVDALPALARILRTAPADIARAAAAALAQMPPKGWRTLEELSANSSPVTAAAAREALERVQGKPGV